MNVTTVKMALTLVDIARLVAAVALYRKQIKKAVPLEAPHLLDGIDNLISRLQIEQKIAEQVKADDATTP